VTDVVEAALTEIVRVGVWALRGLGMRFGVAERAAPIVAWAEAVEGGALKVLRENSTSLAGPRPAEWHAQVSEGTWRFDALGRSLLEIGPVAIDLLTLAARTGKVGQVDIVNANDPLFLSGVARIAAKRKIGIVAMSTGSDLTLCGVPVSTLHVFPGWHGPSFDEGGVPQNSAIDLAVAACREQLKPNRGGLSSMISILSYAPPDVGASFERSAPRFDAEARYALAESHGVRVERDDLAYWYQLEIRTWAPTSERSRTQALA
jgi:hypothetical protein